MTYDEYVAQQEAHRAQMAAQGLYTPNTPIPSQDQWAANQARQNELQTSYQNWQPTAAPWFRNSNTAQADYTRYQQERGLPVDPYILTHAHDPAFLQRHPTEADFTEFKNQLTYGANNPGARYSSPAEFEQAMLLANANAGLGDLSPTQQQALADWGNASPPPEGYDPSRNYGATGGGVPTLDANGNVIYDPATGMGLSPAQQAVQNANQGILANSLGAGNYQVPQQPQTGLLGPVGTPPQGLAANPVRSLGYQELKTPAGLWGGLLDTVQNAGPYTSGNMGFRSPYWNPEPYRTGWNPNAFGTGYAQLNEMIGNAPTPEQVPFVSPESVVNNYYNYDPNTGQYNEGGFASGIGGEQPGYASAMGYGGFNGLGIGNPGSYGGTNTDPFGGLDSGFNDSGYGGPTGPGGGY